ncbi:MAG TPA: hypothetical protein PLL06_17980 [Acidobacteriota bacterium]|jgi:hypothetical protein|nr:hypothetical protein [Acidobacteriota bacterium]HMW03389.1 hypothetical protein [Acidobacteriota bacterium]HMZ81594.1 hypothetical protein [Acidobacteriota bacterium]HNB72578.1 hypothetical protein [Acidobacteriota bacterium]HNC46148.1 hypothetical protein [Acidobacteriota bacterium]
MDQHSDKKLQTTTYDLGNLLNDVIAKSPRVAKALQDIKEEGYDVLMKVEVSVAFQKINAEKNSRRVSEMSLMSETRSARA